MSTALHHVVTLKGRMDMRRYLPEPHNKEMSRHNDSIQGVPGGNVNILGGHRIGHSKQKSLYVHVSYSERFPR